MQRQASPFNDTLREKLVSWAQCRWTRTSSDPFLMRATGRMFIFHMFHLLNDRATSISHVTKRRPARQPSSAGFNVLFLRTASLVSALLALAAKENGIAALPVAITWDIIRPHQPSKCVQHPNSRSSRWSTNYSWRTWLRAVLLKSWPILLSVSSTAVLLVARIWLQQGQLPLFSEQDNPAAFASSRKAR